MDMKNVTGAITALVTPFDAQGNVDFEALEHFVDFQIEQGIDGILALGTTGESSTMTDEEDIEVVKAILAGVDGLLLITPYYNKSNEEGIYQHFSYVLDRVDVPCILYNIPGRTGCSISVRNVQRLAAHPNAWAIKEASGDIAYATKVARYLSDDFTMWSGNDDMIVPLLSLGASGVISVWSNLDPKMVHDLVAAWHRGEVSLARELQLQYLDLVHALFCEVNPIPVKAALARMGLMEENYRLPLWKMTDEHAEVLENAMRKAGLLDA